MAQSPARRNILQSRLAARLILGNLFALLVMLSGFFILGELRDELIQAKIDSLRASGEIVRNALATGATGDSDTAELEIGVARNIVRALAGADDERRTRVRVLNMRGETIADSANFSARLEVEELGPPGRTVDEADFWRTGHSSPLTQADLEATLRGESVSGERRRGDERVVIVTFPIKRVSTVLGALVVETGGVDETVWAERRALLPFALLAFIVITLWSIWLTFNLVRPIRLLSIAANRVRRDGPQRARIPEVGHQKDEIGILSRALAAMTSDLAERINSIEAFAADVAHEIKNPLASIRSSLDTLPVAKTDQQRATLIRVLQHDVARIDRLVTDISAASRLDAEIGAAERVPITLGELIGGIVNHYADSQLDRGVTLELQDDSKGELVLVAPEKMGQVFRNLIDNAITFSPQSGVVRIAIGTDGDEVVAIVEDNGPGIPEEALERIFERFYTQRPKGSDFGSHSGLGLAISRQIVAAHGGTLQASNRAGVSGAQLEVRLPLPG
jgi:two-component system sensor histidine kinase ChvG